MKISNLKTEVSSKPWYLLEMLGLPATPPPPKNILCHLGLNILIFLVIFVRTVKKSHLHQFTNMTLVYIFQALEVLSSGLCRDNVRIMNIWVKNTKNKSYKLQKSYKNQANISYLSWEDFIFI